MTIELHPSLTPSVALVHRDINSQAGLSSMPRVTR